MNSPIRLLQISGSVLLASIFLTAEHSHAQLVSSPPTADPFARETILRMLHQANDWQTAHPRMKPDNRNWERGTWYTGVMAAYEATRDEQFLNQAMNWGRQNEWQVGTERAGANRLFCVETWAELAIIKKDKSLLVPSIQWLGTPATNSPAGAKVWYLEGGVRYADSLYGASALAMLAQATGDAKYLDTLHAFFWDVTDEVFDKEASLYYRDKRFIAVKTPAGKKVFWSRGNGWVLAGIARVLEYLPANDPQRPRYVALFRHMAAVIARCQGSDGLWRPSLADPEHVPAKETSGTGFFCYGMSWGIRNGILDRDTYLPVVKKAWAGLAASLSPEGMVQWGQQVGNRPELTKQDQTHEYVTGTFLLAGSEMLRLLDAGLIAGGKPAAAAEQPTAAPVAAAGNAKPAVDTKLGNENPLLPAAAAVAGPLPTALHPLADRINTFLARQPGVKIAASGLGRNDYLRVIEGQVQAMQPYQNAEGRIIDPVEKTEKYYATPCFAHSIAVLAASGHTQDVPLIESGMKALDVALADMASGKVAGYHGDFFTWPAMFAYDLFQQYAAKERREAWTRNLQAIDPKKLYHQLGNGNNWAVVNLAGEFLRYRRGFASLDHVEARLAGQRSHFTELGMYDEAGNPLPYDHFPRHYLGGMLELGYRGEYFNAYRDFLWRAAWVSLFMQSPGGELPTGFRSSQHIWNEAEQCVTFELFAKAYAHAGRTNEAAAFKRAAHLSLQSVREWIRPDGSGYIVKNRFPIEAKHGYETYSSHTCYNMLACSMLAQAWQFADESVAEQAAPADVGGFVVPIVEPFHKIFANAGSTYVEHDTRGDHKYNPTGLIRIHVRGGHPQLGPSDGCAPYYSGPGVNVCVGPAWQDAKNEWRSLAELSPKPPTVEILEQKPSRASCRVTYDCSTTNAGATRVQLSETIVVEPDGVTVTDEITGDATRIRITWPMLVFDGAETTQVELVGNSASLKMGGRGNRFTLLEPAGAVLKRSGKPLAQRNGMIEVATAEFAGKRAVYRITALASEIK
jgi:rhamnogalacturonyl hydrolase YesR